MNRILAGTILGLALLTGCTVNVGTGSSSPTPESTSASSTTTASPAGGDEEIAGDLKVVNFKFTDSKEGAAREDKKFAQGEVVWLVFDVEGFKMDKDKNVWVQEDLTVTDPTGKPLVQKENLVDLKAPNPNDEKAVAVQNDVTLTDAPDGTYKVNMTVRDKQGNQTVQFEETFEVGPAEEGGE